GAPTLTNIPKQDRNTPTSSQAPVLNFAQAELQYYYKRLIQLPGMPPPPPELMPKPQPRRTPRPPSSPPVDVLAGPPMMRVQNNNNSKTRIMNNHPDNHLRHRQVNPPLQTPSVLAANAPASATRTPA